MDYREALAVYQADDEQERIDLDIMRRFAEKEEDALCRENLLAHFTASAWIVNQSRERVLFVYHKLYRSWSWVGGHADGCPDLLQVAEKEALEETGVRARALTEKPLSLEILRVDRHRKNGCYVPPHLHFNLSYLLAADEGAKLRIRPQENSGVRWFSFDEALAQCTEAHMIPIYQKLIQRCKQQ